MEKKLTIEQKKELAQKFAIDPYVMQAILDVEASGSGFDKVTGRIKIQFEPHWFYKYTRKRIANGVDNQVSEWNAFKVAADIDKHSALLSTSWGLGQIMGFNHASAGYKTVEEMVYIFGKAEYYQLQGMLQFIKNNIRIYNGAVSKDWRAIAKGYNGEEYEKFDYHNRLETQYKAAVKSKIYG